MITIISGTNRKGSKTLKIANDYCDLLSEKKIAHQLFSLTDMPEDFQIHRMYDFENNGLNAITQQYIRSVDKIVFILPEYNGGMPGILKLFIDAVHPRDWKEKRIALIGVASGRAGNLRGLDHLVTLFHYLKMEVYSNKLPISKVEDYFNDINGYKESVKLEMNRHIDGFLRF